MEELPNELFSFIFDFVPEDSLELRKVCDDWDFIVTKHYSVKPIRNPGTFKEIIEIFYRSKLNVKGEVFLDYIRYIYRFDLSWEYIKDVSNLCNVHTLYLNGCREVEDFSCLGNVHTLSLYWTRVLDVSNLTNIHFLNLRHTDVEDVSSLGNVHTLNIHGTKIKSISGLDNVHILYI